MQLIVGLGNPGKRYTKTRHNIGFLVVDALQEYYQDHGGSAWSLEKKFNAEVASVGVGKNKIIFCKPMTYMNASGEAVKLLSSYYKISTDDITIIHDEKDIPFGEVKIQSNRGHAGHNGLKSLIEQLGTKDFKRIRVGIGSSERKMRNTADFVLGKFSLLERTKINKIIFGIVKEIDNTISEA